MNTSNDENDDLWRLLGRVREPRVSPLFSRNVLRAIREQGEKPQPWWVRLRAQWQLVAISAAVLVVVGGFSLERMSRPDPVMVLASRVTASPDLQVISQLDELLDSEQNSVWLDAATY